MDTVRVQQQSEMLSMSQKNAKGKQWYKDKADQLDNMHATGLGSITDQYSKYQNMKVNYDLFNNRMNPESLLYVTAPFGADVGKMPARMVNRDIVSGKIKALLGMEMKRPFDWKVLAVNPEATTRKEQFEFGKVRDFVVNQTLTPIRKQLEVKKIQETRGKKLSPEEIKQLQAQIDEEMKSLTPVEIKKYMERDHQDPAEVMADQLLEYLIEKTDARRKFNNGFKHVALGSQEVFYVGILNGEPEFWDVNPMRFEYEESSLSPFIEDGESASCEYRMRPGEVMKYFGDQLKPADIKKIYEDASYYTRERVVDNLFEFGDYEEEDYEDTVRVLHTVWKSLREIKFLTYLDKNKDKQTMLVDENYELKSEKGDIYLESEWIPEIYETWKIGTDIYVNMRPVPGQFKDIDNIYQAKLPYYGASIDNMNSEPTSIMDRLRNDQTFYNILWYRIETLLATDKGKKLLMNIGMVPDNEHVNIENWEYIFESSPFAWFDPAQEGTGYSDVNTIAKVIDMSLLSDVSKYVDMAAHIKRHAGDSVGITEQVEGQIGPREGVSNVKQGLIQTSHILEPYFNLHNHVKRNVLQGLIETAKVAYSQYGEEKIKLSYVLDGVSKKLLTLDIGLLDESTLGLFVSDTVEISEVRETIKMMAHAALQNQKVEFSDVVAVIKTKSITEAEEILKVAENDRRDFEQKMQEEKTRAAAEQQDRIEAMEDKKMAHEKELVIIKERERRETELMKSAIMGMSFNPETDVNKNGVNDFLELMRNGIDTEIKKKKQNLDEKKFEHQKKIDNKKIAIENKKVNKPVPKS